MKTLTLIRHAPAMPPLKNADDFHRPLSPAGEKEAKRMADLIKAEGAPPDLIISSPADRALETAHIFARAWGKDVRKILLVEMVYQGRPLDQLQTMIRALDDRCRKAVIVGHNPSLSDLAGLLLRRNKLEIPKVGVLTIRFETEAWQECGPQNASLASLLVSRSAIESGKWAKPLRRELTARMWRSLRDVLAAVDPEHADLCREAIKPGLKKAAARFLKQSDRIRLTDKDWLDRFEPEPAEKAAPAARPKTLTASGKKKARPPSAAGTPGRRPGKTPKPAPDRTPAHVQDRQ